MIRTLASLIRVHLWGRRIHDPLLSGAASKARGKPAAEDLIWFNRIEAHRKTLLKSPEILSNAPLNDSRDTLGRITNTCSKRWPWCRLLFYIVRAHKPKACLELGTCVGISAAYQSAALELNGDGTLITLEGVPDKAEAAKANLSELGLSAQVVTGRFAETLPTVLNHMLDYVFIDGHHDERATIDYFDQLLPFLSDRALVIFDDIRWSAGMKRAWHVVSNHQRVTYAVDLGSIGICRV